MWQVFWLDGSEPEISTSGAYAASKFYNNSLGLGQQVGMMYLLRQTFLLSCHLSDQETYVSGSRYPWWHTCAPTASLIARVLDSIAGSVPVLVGHELSDVCCCATAR